MRRNHHHRPRLWLGLGLAVLGSGLLLREFGLLPAHIGLVDFWPLALILAGVSRLLRARGFSGSLFALALVALGALVLAGNLGFVALPTARLWPALLVLLGLAFLLGGARASKGPEPSTDPPAGACAGLSLETEDDRINKQIMFSGLELKIESQAWKGGVLDVTAGGVELDLRYARLAPEGAVLEVRIVMGGVDIRVPDTWQVRCDVTPLLGGADDMSRSTQGSAGAPVLRVIGSATLGGVSIHN
jgi:hypothetical protein